MKDILTYNEVQKYIAEVKKKELEDISAINMYLVSPLLAAGNYNVFDFNVAEIHFKTGRVSVKILENLNMLVSQDDVLNTETKEYLGEYKIHLRIDFTALTYSLYFNVLDNWELVETVDFKVASSDKDKDKKTADESAKFIRMQRYIARASISKGYQDKDEKYFTEAVLDNYLENQRFNNQFIRTALLNEFKKPSDELITMLASALGKEFTTMSLDDVKERLKPLAEKGLYDAIETLIQGNPNISYKKPETKISNDDLKYLQGDVKNSVDKDVKKEIEKETKVDSETPSLEKEPEVVVKKEVVEDKKDLEKDKDVLENTQNDDILKDMGIIEDKKPLAKPKNYDNQGFTDLSDLV